MRPSEALNLHRGRIRQIALSHHVQDIRVFGSAPLGEDVEGSDLDLLVEPTAETTLFDIGAIRFELKQLLGLDIEVLTPNALPNMFRAQVLKEAQPWSNEWHAHHAIRPDKERSFTSRSGHRNCISSVGRRAAGALACSGNQSQTSADWHGLA
jgi:uncharacterized protein